MMSDIAITVLVGYVVGSIPAAYLIGRLAAGLDVRAEGEGNVGARNVFHVAGPGWGVATFLADLSKGAIVAGLFRDRPVWQLAVAGVAVLVGHAFPVWLGFLGGKGLSTVGGFTIVLMPVASAIGGGAAAVAWVATRQFLPTLVAAIVTAIVAAPLVGTRWAIVGIVVGLFSLTGVKRALDEGRMREVEARTGWHRTKGLRA